MVCLQFGRVQAAALAAAGMFCLAASEKLAAQSEATPVNVTYTATGVFASPPPIAGNDLFELAGEPFSISVTASSAAKPVSHTRSEAKYTKLMMAGTVTSGIEPTMPLSISDTQATLELTVNPKYDLLTFFSPVAGGVIGYPIDIEAVIQMPPGTISKPTIHPFSSITLGPCTSPVPPGPCVDQVTYKDPQTGQSTTLGIASGTLVATIPGKDATEEQAGVQLHAGGAQVVTAHADGTQSLRAIGDTPVELGDSSDKVALRFFASGVRAGAEIHVQIAGQDVPVLYAGPAGHFAGLDEVSVALPRSLAGSGYVEVSLTVDGQTASPLHIHIQ